VPRPLANADTTKRLYDALGDAPLDRAGPIAPQIYDRIRLAIILSDLESGMMVNEAEVATIFKVSRTPVRTAYVRLSADGLIETRAHVGSVVAPRDEAKVREGAIIRRALEGEVVEALALGRPDLTPVRRYLAEQKFAVDIGDATAFFHADEKFHSGLAELAGIPNAWRLVHSVKGHTDRARMELMSNVENRTLKAYEEHLALLDLIEAGLVAEARAAMSRHINSVFDALGIEVGASQIVQSVRSPG